MSNYLATGVLILVRAGVTRGNARACRSTRHPVEDRWDMVEMSAGVGVINKQVALQVCANGHLSRFCSCRMSRCPYFDKSSAHLVC